MQRMLHGPSLSTLFKWISDTDCPRFDDLLDLDNVTAILDYYRERGELDDGVMLLSVDAMKADEDLCIDHTGHVDGLISVRNVENPEEYRQNHDKYIKQWEDFKRAGEVVGSIFIITACPLNENTTFPIHIHLAQNGNANDDVEIAVAHVTDIMRDYGLDVRLIGSDADVKYRTTFEEDFIGWTRLLSGCKGNVMEIEFPSCMWSNDCAHILKRARSRLVTHGRLYADRDAEKQKFPEYNSYVDVETLKSINPLMSDTWFRNNGRDSMDDYYPHYIFSGETIKGIMSTIPTDGTSAAPGTSMGHVLNYTVPMTCLAKILRHKNADRKLRLQWAYLALYIMLLNYSWIKKQCGNKELKRENYSSYFTIHLCIDCCNWLFCLIHTLGGVDASFSLSRLGSIISEHLFAQLRFYAQKEQTVRSVRAAFNRMSTLKHLGDWGAPKVEKRWISCATIEPGCVVLSSEELQPLLHLAQKIAHMAGIVIPREAEFYDLVKDNKPGSLTKLTDEERIFIDTLCTDEFKYINNGSTHGWRLQTSRFRIGGSKIGRNIESRYKSATKITPMEPEAPSKSSDRDSAARHEQRAVANKIVSMTDA